jgi:hypothetical protein
MLAILHALGMFIADLFKSRSRLDAENLLLRHQLNLAHGKRPLILDCEAVTERCWFGWSDCGQACLTWSRSFSPKQSFVGIAPDFEASGGGNLGIG